MRRFTASLFAVFTFVCAAAGAPADTAAPPGKPLVVRTADGLPMEVELVSVHRGELRVRNLASKREIPLVLAKLDAKTRKLVDDEVNRVRQSIRGDLKFTATVETNPSNLKPSTVTTRRAPLQTGASSVSSRTLQPGGRCVRLVSTALPKGPPTVDIPVEAHVFWYKAAGKSGWDGGSPEKAILTVSNLPGEYLSNPVKFENNSYKGFVVIVVNPANGAVLWERTEGTLGSEFLKDAKKRLGGAPPPIATPEVSTPAVPDTTPIPRSTRAPRSTGGTRR
jgi:hypothetical protein